MVRPVLTALALLLACNDGAADTAASLSQSTQASTLSAGEPPGTTSMTDTTGSSSSGGSSSSTSTASSAPTGEDAGTTTADPGTTTDPTTADIPPITCTYPSTSFGAAAQELMVSQGSDQQLSFTVPGLPDPAGVVTATLRFVSYDSDHAGAEGVIHVNDDALDLPADAAWENAEHATAVEVTGMTVPGDNTVTFGAGSLVDGTFYRIADVALELVAHVEACPDAPAQPPKAVQLDCGGLYDPDGTRTGTATFTFVDLAPATYEITIKARHSANRNPKGALFVVDGEGKRIDQTSGEDIVVDTWGTKALAGTVEMVLDSDMEPESDSVTWVRLEPV